MSELAKAEVTDGSLAIEAVPVPALTADQAAALVAAVERIACHVTGSSRDDPATAYMRLGFKPHEVKALLAQ